MEAVETSEARLFVGTVIGMQHTTLHGFIDFAVGRRDLLLDCLLGVHAGIRYVGIDSSSAIFDQRLDCRLICLIA
jgi:hypothetical protein